MTPFSQPRCDEGNVLRHAFEPIARKPRRRAAVER
jgi:hypothetical protein